MDDKIITNEPVPISDTATDTNKAVSAPDTTTDGAPAAVSDLTSFIADSVANPAIEATELLLRLFEHMDATAPTMRLIIAGSIVGVSLLLILITRFITHRHVVHLEALPDEQFNALRWQSQDLVSKTDMKAFWTSVWRGIGWLFTMLLGFVALTGLLMSFSWSLRLAAGLIVFFGDAIAYVWYGFIGYLPNLITIALILLVARYVIRLIGLVFEGIRNRRIFLKNFYPEWAETSFSIIKIMIIVVTAVIIFPYLPGSSSPAFQGISIFVGVLLTLGSTTAVANVVAGVVLTYTRAFKVGDQVEIADTRGRIVESSTFVTRIQTLKNVVVSVPNSMVLNNNIINYSKNLGQRGLLVHTAITIGYDVPWQKVHSLLIAAANKTDNIAESPEPFVLQTSLEDNYVAYEINGWALHPEELPRIYSELHANILDEFHGHQVEITSPHYRAVRDGNAVAIPESSMNETQGSPVEASTSDKGTSGEK